MMISAAQQANTSLIIEKKPAARGCGTTGLRNQWPQARHLWNTSVRGWAEWAAVIALPQASEELFLCGGTITFLVHIVASICCSW